jgi:hypothetical protein
VLPRFVPSRRVLRIVAWVAFWPVAYVAAPGSLIAALLIIVAFVPVVAHRRMTDIVGGGAVGYAVSLVARAMLPHYVGLTVGVGALFGYEWLMRRAHEREGDPLDASARLLAPVGLAIAIDGAVIGLGAQAAHLHSTFPLLAQLFASVGVAIAILAVFAWRSIGVDVARAYRGDDGMRRVRKIDDDVDVPRLSDVAPADAAIVEGATRDAGPYRAGEGRPLARVPIDASVMRRIHRWRLGEAIVATLVCVGAGSLTVAPLVKIAHRSDLASSPATLPPLPGECATHPPKLRFVALAPLRVLDIDDIAARYRATRVVDVVVEPPLEVEELWIDRGRHQIAGEDIARAARKKYRADENELVIVVTDRDMFLREADWRFAFATREAGVAVVSIARMDPHFPLFAPGGYDPKPSECPAPVRARAFRMITRQVLFQACSAESVADPRSARRRSVMGLSDLDAIDEATY